MTSAVRMNPRVTTLAVIASAGFRSLRLIRSPVPRASRENDLDARKTERVGKPPHYFVLLRNHARSAWALLTSDACRIAGHVKADEECRVRCREIAGLVVVRCEPGEQRLLSLTSCSTLRTQESHRLRARRRHAKASFGKHASQRGNQRFHPECPANCFIAWPIVKVDHEMSQWRLSPAAFA